MKLLPLNLGPVANLVDKDKTLAAKNHATSGVHLKIADGKFIAESTNGRYFVQASGACKGSTDYPVSLELTNPDQKDECVISGEVWTRFFADAGKATNGKYVKPLLKSAAVAIHENETVLYATNGEAVAVSKTKNLEGRYPRTENVMPRGEPFCSFMMHPADFALVLTTIDKLNPIPDLMRAVTIDLFLQGGGVSLIKVRSNQEDMPTVGLIVPIRDNGGNLLPVSKEPWAEQLEAVAKKLYDTEIELMRAKVDRDFWKGTAEQLEGKSGGYKAD